MKKFNAEEKFYLRKTTVCGTAIAEYSVCSDPDDKYRVTPKTPLPVSVQLAGFLSRNVILGGGMSLTLTEGAPETGNYIMISARSLDMTSYSITVDANGNIYVKASAYSAEDAVEKLLEILGASKEADKAVAKAVTEADSFSGKSEFSIPYTKEELYGAIKDAYSRDDMIITGCHCFNFEHISNGTAMENTIETIQRATTYTPAFMEYDLGMYSSINTKNNGEDLLKDYDVSRVLAESMDHIARGGFVGVCAHIDNPVQLDQGCRGFIGSNETFRELYTKGTELNKKLDLSNSVVLKFLKAYHDNGIPLLFRPLHEMTGDWFWWCIYQGSYGCEGKIDAENWHNLWKYFHNYFGTENGLDNLIWVYSTAMKEADYPYPGDEYVDVVGCDWYTGANREVNANNTYETLMSLGKPVSLTEFGFGGPNAAEAGYTCEVMLEDLKWMKESKYKMAFILVWSTHAAYAGMTKGDKFFEDPMIYDRNKMAEYWKK